MDAEKCADGIVTVADIVLNLFLWGEGEGERGRGEREGDERERGREREPRADSQKP